MNIGRQPQKKRIVSQPDLFINNPSFNSETKSDNKTPHNSSIDFWSLF